MAAAASLAAALFVKRYAAAHAGCIIVCSAASSEGRGRAAVDHLAATLWLLGRRGDADRCTSSLPRIAARGVAGKRSARIALALFTLLLTAVATGHESRLPVIGACAAAWRWPVLLISAIMLARPIATGRLVGLAAGARWRMRVVLWRIAAALAGVRARCGACAWACWCWPLLGALQGRALTITCRDAGDAVSAHGPGSGGSSCRLRC